MDIWDITDIIADPLFGIGADPAHITTETIAAAASAALAHAVVAPLVENSSCYGTFKAQRSIAKEKVIYLDLCRIYCGAMLYYL